MIRGTTPTLKFTFPFDITDVEFLTLTFVQGGKELLTKNLSDFSIDGVTATCTLSESETLLFDSSLNWVQMQFKLGSNGMVSASNIIRVDVDKILNEDVFYG